MRSEGRRPPFDLSVYLVTDPALCASNGLAETVVAAVRGGISVVQLRDKSAPDSMLIEQGLLVKRILASTTIPLIVNDRVGVALAIGADGLHLGQSDMSVRDARSVLGDDAIIGLSVHNLSQARAVEYNLIDYIGVGPIFGTPTKPDHEVPLGFSGLAAICRESLTPSVAIGGLRPEHVRHVHSAGAAGVAVVSSICGVRDPEQATRAFVRATDDTHQPGR